MIDARTVVGTCNILLVTLDSLRYDVAVGALAQGQTPHLARLMSPGRWERRHSAGTFTWPAHHAIFAGFFPKPAEPGRPTSRLLECRPPTGKPIRPTTYVVEGSCIVTGLAAIGYRTVCIGGVSYFSGETPLGGVFPAMFGEAYWRPEFGSDCRESTRHQVDTALDVVREVRDAPTFLFINVSATHVPHHHYLSGAQQDGCASQGAALAYADGELGRLFAALPGSAPWLVIICADHGDAFGDDGYTGHGVAHPCVWTVPYVELYID